MQRTNLFLTLPNDVCYNCLETPVGKLLIVANEKALHAILWDKDCSTTAFSSFIGAHKKWTNAIIQATKQQLKEYFQKKRHYFNIPLVLNGTHFQQQAWKVLQEIPYGKTLSYAEQANCVGNKNKARAVGTANAVNPISIIVPCHRVIATNGKLTGFAGGLDRKAYLLDLEQTGEKNDC